MCSFLKVSGGEQKMETWFIMCQLRAKISKTTTGKAYIYRMLLSFKTSVTYKKITSHQTTVPVVKQLSSDIIRFFAGHYSTSSANMWSAN